MLCADTLAYHVQHLGLERLAHTPEQVVGNILDVFPEFHVIHARAPFNPEMAFQHFDPFGSQKGRSMHAIRHVSHRVFLMLDLRPHVSANVR